MDARSRLLQPYDEEVTIWQTFSAGAGGETADEWHRPAERPIRLVCEPFVIKRGRRRLSLPAIVAAVVDRGILAIS